MYVTVVGYMTLFAPRVIYVTWAKLAEPETALYLAIYSIQQSAISMCQSYSRTCTQIWTRTEYNDINKPSI